MFPKCQIAAQLVPPEWQITSSRTRQVPFAAKPQAGYLDNTRRYCKASRWSSQLRLIDMIDMVSPWSQAQAILGFDGGGLMPTMLLQE